MPSSAYRAALFALVYAVFACATLLLVSGDTIAQVPRGPHPLPNPPMVVEIITVAFGAFILLGLVFAFVADTWRELIGFGVLAGLAIILNYQLEVGFWTSLLIIYVTLILLLLLGSIYVIVFTKESRSIAPGQPVFLFVMLVVGVVGLYFVMS